MERPEREGGEAGRRNLGAMVPSPRLPPSHQRETNTAPSSPRMEARQNADERRRAYSEVSLSPKKLICRPREHQHNETCHNQHLPELIIPELTAGRLVVVEDDIPAPCHDRTGDCAYHLKGVRHDATPPNDVPACWAGIRIGGHWVVTFRTRVSRHKILPIRGSADSRPVRLCCVNYDRNRNQSSANMLRQSMPISSSCDLLVIPITWTD